MRDDDSIVKDVRDILLNMQELKETQLVGTDQIRIHETLSDPTDVTTQTTSEWYSAYATAELVVTAPKILPTNELITYCVAEVRKNGVLVTNKSTGQLWWLGQLHSDVHNEVHYSLTIAEVSEDENPLPGPSTFQVIFHVFSSANVTLEVNV